jgi:thiol:disulfide interchange protein DsbC
VFLGVLTVFKKLILCGFLFLFATLPVLADEKSDIKEIKKVFSQIVPDALPDIVSPSALEGIYEVVYGAQIIYMSKDGRYVIQGDLIDLKSRTNLTEGTRSIQRAKLVKSIDDSSAIIFEPKKVKHTITVFTDIDCGYCRKLHREINQYTDLGIKVRYLSFPRSGVDTKSYYKAVTVWCSKDKRKALTEAKAGVKQDELKCDNPVKEHMKLAEQFGVSGTPTIVLDNGEVIPGYVPAERLSRMLANVEQASLN